MSEDQEIGSRRYCLYEHRKIDQFGRPESIGRSAFSTTFPDGVQPL